MKSRANIKLSDQLEQRQQWKRPLVDAVVATFCYRKVKDREIPEGGCVLDTYEWLVSERVNGAENGQFQSHHGGYVDVIDIDIWAAACRELFEETGYNLQTWDLSFLTLVGPAIYRSELSLDRGSMTLSISDEEAESQTGFILSLFIADLSDCSPNSKTDGEVKNICWLSGRQIIEAYGSKKAGQSFTQFNYFQFFVIAMLQMSDNKRTTLRPVSQPGVYSWSF